MFYSSFIILVLAKEIIEENPSMSSRRNRELEKDYPCVTSKRRSILDLPPPETITERLQEMSAVDRDGKEQADVNEALKEDVKRDEEEIKRLKMEHEEKKERQEFLELHEKMHKQEVIEFNRLTQNEINNREKPKKAKKRRMPLQELSENYADEVLENQFGVPSPKHRRPPIIGSLPAPYKSKGIPNEVGPEEALEETVFVHHNNSGGAEVDDPHFTLAPFSNLPEDIAKEYKEARFIDNSVQPAVINEDKIQSAISPPLPNGHPNRNESAEPQFGRLHTNLASGFRKGFGDNPFNSKVVSTEKVGVVN